MLEIIIVKPLLHIGVELYKKHLVFLQRPVDIIKIIADLLDLLLVFFLA